MFFTGVTAGNGLVFNDSSMPGRDTDADNEVIDLVDMTSGVSITGTAYTVNKSYGNKWVEGFGQTNFTTPIFAVEQQILALGKIERIDFRSGKASEVLQFNPRNSHSSPSMMRIVSSERRECKAPRMGWSLL